jgi:Amt family ammonium transporter
VQQEIARSTRDRDYRFGVMLVEFDRLITLKSCSTPIDGDDLLIAFAKRVRQCVRPADTVARVASEQFGVVLEGVDEISKAEAVAARMQRDLARPIALGDAQITAVSAIGVAISRTVDRAISQRADDLLRDAETAMRHAKSAAADSAPFKIFDANMDSAADRRARIEHELRRAIANDEFDVHYQPIVSLSTGRIESLEALARWRHPQREGGLISPLDFIPLAEEAGLIAEVERLIMARACREVAELNRTLPADRNVGLSINISAHRFVQRDLRDDLMSMIVPSGLSPDLIKLEITEAVILQNRDHAADTLNQLKQLGIRVSLDDFGTGYSSLSSLHRFPVDVIKIDRAFVKSMRDSDAGGNDLIVRMITTLAKHLKMIAVAEGVENEHQLERLREIGCDFGQGYYFSKPLSAGETTQFLARHLAGQRAFAA